MGPRPVALLLRRHPRQQLTLAGFQHAELVLHRHAPPLLLLVLHVLLHFQLVVMEQLSPDLLGVLQILVVPAILLRRLLLPLPDAAFPGIPLLVVLQR